MHKYKNLMVIFFLFLYMPFSWAIRCVNDRGSCVITDSDTKYALLLCCGQPEFIEYRTGLFGDDFIDVEQYVYDCRGFMQRVTIQNGNITDIETLTRGNSTHRCY